VLKNSTTPAHATGAGGAFVTAFVTMMLSANAADANAPQENPRTIPAEAPNLLPCCFVMCGPITECEDYEGTTEWGEALVEFLRRFFGASFRCRHSGYIDASS
jgi:hypothetical protein